jgi:signal peptidase II
VAYGALFAARNDYEGTWLHGRVVDMFYLDLWRGHLPESWPLVGGQYYTFWPVFNIADVAISVGIVLVLLGQRRLFRPVAGGPPSQPQPPPTPNP